jgi:PKD repeat protein
VGQAVGIEIGALQMAPDGKIYVAKNSSPFCGVINDPSILGAGCNYVDNGFSISPNMGIEGLPNFIQSIFTEAPALPIALFNTTDNHICPGTCTDFSNLSVNGNSYLWSFQGANPSTSVDVNPTNICYSTPGTYSVELITSNAVGSDTLTLNNFITVYPNPAPQGIAQSGDTLFANPGANAYQWYYGGNLIAGATAYFYVAPASGDYNVVATDPNGCEVEAAIFDVIAGLTPASASGEGIQLYPNPVNDMLYVQCKVTPAGIYIYDLIGEAVCSMQLENRSQDMTLPLNVQSLPPGIYWIKLVSPDKISYSKFMKSAGR